MCNQFRVSIIIILFPCQFLYKPSVVSFYTETSLKLSILINLLENLIFCVKIIFSAILPILHKLCKKMLKTRKTYCHSCSKVRKNSLQSSGLNCISNRKIFWGSKFFKVFMYVFILINRELKKNIPKISTNRIKLIINEFWKIFIFN